MIRDQLLEVIRRHYQSQADFQRRWKLGRSTMREWLDGKRPKPPTLRFLVRLAERHHLSLDGLVWGPPHRLYRAGRFQLMRGVRDPRELMRELRQQLDTLLRAAPPKKRKPTPKKPRARGRKRRRRKG